MIIRKLSHNRRIKSIKFDERNLDEMSDHLIGRRLSAYRENVYDADGDGKVTLRDFIHRIKNLAGAELSVKIKETDITITTTGGGY
jgi:hypothetical protein